MPGTWHGKGVPLAWLLLTSFAPPVEVDERPAEANHDISESESIEGLPLGFEPNRGQAAPDVHFLARARGLHIRVKPRGAVLSLGSPGAARASVALRFAEADPDPRIEGTDPRPGTVHYLVGSAPSGWLTDIPTYGGVVYREPWPGIDLAVGGDRHRLEIEARLDPGADPDALVLEVVGADSLVWTDSGELSIRTALGSLRQLRPVAWQDDSGAIDVETVSLGDRRIGFRLGDHDPSRTIHVRAPLVYVARAASDPPLIDGPFRVAVQDDGSVLLTGRVGMAAESAQATRSSFIRSGRVHFERESLGGRTAVRSTERVQLADACVMRIAPDGSNVLWTTYFGGEGLDEPLAIAVEKDGAITVAGRTSSTRFPTMAAIQNDPGGGADAFVSRLTPDGDRFVFSSYFGGRGDDEARGVAVDLDGATWLTGTTSSTDLPTEQARQPEPGGETDAFVVKLDGERSSVLHASYLGGSGEDAASAIAIGPDGSVHVAGSTASDDFPLINAEQPVIGSGDSTVRSDAFVTKLAFDGAVVPYSTYLGGSADERATSIAVDAEGRVWIAGWTESDDFPISGVTGTSCVDDVDSRQAFVTRLEPSGEVVLATCLGGEADTSATGIATASSGRVWVAGTSNATGLPGVESIPPSRGFDVFATELDPDGTVRSTRVLGGANDESTGGIAVDPFGGAVVVGATRSDHSDDLLALEPAFGAGDAFIGRLAATSTPLGDGCPGGTVGWDGDGDGVNWTDPLNWTGDLLPGPGDDVCIDGAAVTLASGSQQIGTLEVTSTASLTLSGGGFITLTIDVSAQIDGPFTLDGNFVTLAGNGDVTVGGLFTWNSGTLDEGGTLTANGGIDLTAGSLARTLNNNGTTTWTGTFEFAIFSTGTFNNNGTFDSQNDQTILNVGTFNNKGIFLKSAGTSTTRINTVFNSSGSVSITSGPGATLRLDGGGTGSGNFNAPVNTTLLFADNYTFDVSSSVTGNGLFLVTGGTVDVVHSYAFGGATQVVSGTSATLNFEATATVQALTLSGESVTLGGAGDVTITGLFTWISGALADGGTLTAGGGIDLTAGTLNRTLNNNDTTTWTGTSDFTITAAGTFNNNGTFDVQNDQTILDVGTFDNGGTFLKSDGTALTTVAVPFQNSGTVEAQAAELVFGDSYVQTGGLTRLAGGSITTLSSLEIQGGLLEGVGTVTGDVSTEPAGRVGPGLSAGILDVDGNFTAGATGIVAVEIGGLKPGSEHDQFNMTNGATATLGGSIDVTLVGPSTPMPGDSFTVMTFASKTGAFAAPEFPAFPTGRFEIVYSDTSVVLSVVECLSNEQCDDSASCTIDVCNAGVCENTADHNVCDNGLVCDGTETCDPDGGEPVTGCKEGLPEPLGTPCGDPSSGLCDNPDTCDGAGSCQDNNEPPTTECRAAVGDCDVAELCDGTGSCPADDFESAGTACGDPTDDQCVNPDSCDGAGTCLANDESPGTACDDGSGCTEDDACDPDGTCAGTPIEGCIPCADAGDCDDANECTVDTCVAQSCVFTNAVVGTSCGDTSDTVCTNPDTCDGAGACQPNDEPPTTECRADAGECDVAEFCDGAGSCPSDGFEPSGTACGDASDTECTDPDTCDGAGACQLNDEPPTTVCRADADECDVAEFCDGAGSCPADGFEPSGTACGDASDTECTNPDTCDGAGVCDANDEVVGFACGDTSDTVCTNPDTCDGAGACQPNDEPPTTECRADAGECDVAEFCDGAGSCPSDGFEPSGTACGDASDTECTNPDTCDGAGVCDANDQVAGFACGNPTDDPCTNPDSCDGAGSCQANDESSGTPCPDASFCNGEETCDGSGACQPGGDPCPPDGVGCTVDGCDETSDVCTYVPDDSACDNGLFCDGAETCDVVNDCQPGSDPCPGEGCDEVGDVCVTTQVTVCSILADDPSSNLDQDLWTFGGVGNDSVTITLEAQDSDNQGRANLILIQDGGELFIADHTDLPNAIAAELPADGTYIVAVTQQSEDDLLPGQPFTGVYCLTVAAEFPVILTADSSVEP